MRTLARALAVLAIAILARPANANTCAQQGCEATVRALSSGGYVVEGTAVVILDGTVYKTCPTPGAWYVIKDGQALQTIPGSWVMRQYFCCCSNDWLGEFADVLTFAVEPGDRLTIALGDMWECAVEVVVPKARDPWIPCDSNPDRLEAQDQ